MKYVQINSFYNGSTGTIMKSLHAKLQADGHESYICWGRRHETINDHEQCCASNLGVYSHGVRARLTDRVGFYSKGDTKKLLEKLDEIDPDVVHLHNIHGYYINIEMLFRWLEKRNQKTYWTLHDCWSFTGHCSHFTYVKCDQWKSHCSYQYKCPQKGEYPKSYLLDNSKRNFDDKKRLFTSLPADRLTLITPSRWLADLVGQSFLSKYPVEVRYNEIDRTVFKPTPSDFRIRTGIDNRFLILGVASPWKHRKGLEDFQILADVLDQDYAIVLVGLNGAQIKNFRERLGNRAIQSDESQKLSEVLGVFEAMKKDSSRGGRSDDIASLDSGLNGCRVLLMERTENQAELVEIYTAADVFFNPTLEDNYPTVNLESEACGTPVVTYDTGGCAETINLEQSCVIKV